MENIDAIKGIVDSFFSEFEQNKIKVQENDKLSKEIIKLNTIIMNLNKDISDLNKDIENLKADNKELQAKADKSHSLYLKYKHIAEEKDKEIEQLKGTVDTQNKHNAVLENKLIVAHRLSDEERYRGTLTTKENAEKERVNIAQAIQLYIQRYLNCDVTQRVDLQAIVNACNVSSSTIYDFRSALLTQQIDPKPYLKYNLFIGWLQNKGRFKNTKGI